MDLKKSIALMQALIGLTLLSAAGLALAQIKDNKLSDAASDAAANARNSMPASAPQAPNNPTANPNNPYPGPQQAAARVNQIQAEQAKRVAEAKASGKLSPQELATLQQMVDYIANFEKQANKGGIGAGEYNQLMGMLSQLSARINSAAASASNQALPPMQNMPRMGAPVAGGPPQAVPPGYGNRFNPEKLKTTQPNPQVPALYMAEIEKITNFLVGVKTPADAEKAILTIQPEMKRLKRLDNAFDELILHMSAAQAENKMTPEMTRLAATMASFEQVGMRLESELDRVEKLGLSPQALAVLKQIRKELDD